MPTQGSLCDANRWIGRRGIGKIEGALKASAYVGRAYKRAQHQDGQPPPWARKLRNGRWLFDIEYIEADARRNLATIGISEAASLLGASRRTIQTWADEGILPLEGKAERERGDPRRILREAFMRTLPELGKRLETPAVVGFRRSREQSNTSEASQVSREVEGESQFRSAAEKTAAAIESRFSAAREDRLRRIRDAAKRPTESTGARTSRSGKTLPDRSKSAAMLESRLRQARETRQTLVGWEDRATRIAQKLADDVDSGELERIDAAILLNQIAEREGMPDDIRIEITRKYFRKR